ncbi:unnamed protein product [Adineta steineri]|uniref:Uncharacterized protein n=1 Tax=Adineta steineri TaxID=433720 RepID=A0A818U7E6_9BILA|nr:unnamed protein product [Adineta steineri]CAF3693254.1 unnamed protein product [Adineta steineri]
MRKIKQAADDIRSKQQQRQQSLTSAISKTSLSQSNAALIYSNLLKVRKYAVSPLGIGISSNVGIGISIAIGIDIRLSIDTGSIDIGIRSTVGIGIGFVISLVN